MVIRSDQRSDNCCQKLICSDLLACRQNNYLFTVAIERQLHLDLDS